MIFALMSDNYGAWEHRIGSFFTACPHCRQDAWQLTFRLYQTMSTGGVAPGPYTPPMNERFQVRCATCGAATQVDHPSTWAPTLGVAFNPEGFGVTRAIPAYFALQPKPL